MDRADSRVEMCIGWKRRWPFPVKKIWAAKECSREEAVRVAMEFFEMSPNVVAVAVMGDGWQQKITREDWKVTVGYE